MKSNSAENLIKLCEEYVEIIQKKDNSESLKEVEESIISICIDLNEKAIAQRYIYKARMEDK